MVHGLSRNARRLLGRTCAAATGAALAVALAGTAAAQAAPAGSALPAAARPAGSAASGGAEHGRFAHVDVLFVGAHPDDESGDLATFGQWNEYDHVTVGELTITRGEGGGDAVGNLSGPPLAQLREAEQRRALAYAGMYDVYYLDKPDFYYTTSETLVAKDWNWQSTLGQVVRVIRETEPKVIVTMGPMPFLGQHGAHQFAARAAIAAFELAADPAAYPNQITGEHLKPWAVSRIFMQARPGPAPTGIGTASVGPGCATSLQPADPSQDDYGVWAGRPAARYGTTWAQVQVDADHQYASQGFAVIPPAPTDPNQIGCQWFTEVASRVPASPADHGATAMLDGAVLRGPGAPPLGTGLTLATQRYDVLAGTSLGLTATVTAPRRSALPGATLRVQVPAGWAAPAPVRLGTIPAGRSRTVALSVDVPAGVAVGTRLELTALLQTRRGWGTADAPVTVVAPVTATLPELAETTAFDGWADTYHLPQLEHTIQPVLSLGSGQSRQVTVTVRNNGGAPASGTVTPQVPAGFSVTPASRSYSGLAAGAAEPVTFTLTNTDTTLAVGNAGGDAGDYPVSVRTTSGTGPAAVQQGVINLVPVTTIPQAQHAPVVDGTASPGEYPGPTLDVSNVWQGPACATASMCSASAQLSWYGDALYALVTVEADSPGTVVTPDNCQQDWRTDAVGIDISPQGTYTSDDLSQTLKLDIFPETDDPAHGNGPCAQSDADFHQTVTFGQISTAELMPGLQIASKVTTPFTGYTIEVKIPFADLPAAVNPQHMGLNIIDYYSNNDQLIGTTRLAWSAWNSVQSDPFHWGVASVAGYQPPDPALQRPVVFPNTPLAGIDSPQSILQAARTGVPLSGAPLAARGDSGRLVGRPGWSAGAVRVRLRATGPGLFAAFVWDPVTGRTAPAAGVLGTASLQVSRAGTYELTVPVPQRPPAATELAVAFQNAVGANDSSAAGSIAGTG